MTLKNCIFGAIIALAPFAVAQVPSVENGGISSTGTTASASSAYPAAPRHWEVTILRSSPEGSIANGGYYNLAPGAQKPTGTIRQGTVTMDALSALWESPGRIFIRGLADLPDSAAWSGMLELDGVYRYRSIYGAVTLPAYKLSRAADPIATASAGKPAWQPHSTALDAPARR